jgi:hypothetical protein
MMGMRRPNCQLTKIYLLKNPDLLVPSNKIPELTSQTKLQQKQTIYQTFTTYLPYLSFILNHMHYYPIISKQKT